MCNKVRFALFGLLIAVGLALTPAAFARGHLGVGISIGLPGLSLGYGGGGYYGGGYGRGGYYGGGYGGGYYGGGYTSYYAPAPVYYGPAYYGAAYDSYPAYYGSAGYYYNAPVRRTHGYSGRYDHGHRASYYDRSGYYRH